MKKVFSILVLILLVPSFPQTTMANGYTNVTVSEAKTMIDSNPSLVVLDVRTQSEYDSGHIRNAKLIPVTELEGRLNELNKTDETLVYCRSGGRSTTASQILADNGFLHVYNMLGGITAWIAAGYPAYVKYASIQEAINNANEGDTIYVSSGTYCENVVVNKTVSLIGEHKDSTILNGTTIEPIMIVEANDAKISGFTFESWAFQNIVITTTTGVIIVENKIIFNTLGIDVENSVNTTIENNIINGFGLDNIGIMLAYSSECSIVNNKITNAVYDGIRLWFSSSNLIRQNLIKDNEYGIFFHQSNLNTISENTISESRGSGIYIESSSSNYVLHNNFIDNYHQAMIYDNSVNTWDNGYEGNYWNNHNGTDSDGDGIRDTPYIINANNADRHPLMNMYWNPADINHDLKVDMKDVGKAARAFASYPGHPFWNPHADITGETYLVPDGKVDMRDIAFIAKNFGKTYA